MKTNVMKISIIVLVVLSSAVVCGCSIKEDRSECPCRLVIDFSEVDPEVHPELALNIVDASGFSYSAVLKPVPSTVSPAGVSSNDNDEALTTFRAALSADREGVAQDAGNEMYPSEYVVEVPRRGVYVNVWSKVAEDYLSDSAMVIPRGRDCPPVYRHFSNLQTDAEVVREKVEMHKQYCGLSLFFVNEGTPYSVNVRGEVNGYAYDGSLSQGEFSCPVANMDRAIGRGLPATANGATAWTGKSGETLGGADGFAVRLPKQADASLLMDVVMDGSVLKTFALGNYIEASGYDWSAEDLEDLTVGIDYSNTKVLLTVSGWKESFTYELVF